MKLHVKYSKSIQLIFYFSIGILFTWILASSTSAQQTRDLTAVKPKVSDKRTALVIGNANYTVATSLRNPKNDAEDMAKALEELGFKVFSGTDLTRSQMRKKLLEFGDELKNSGGVGLFYYAGHGVQVNGINYLIPVNADIPREDEIEDVAFRLNGVFDKMAVADNGFNIVILDACRNNPFARSWSRSMNTDGLAQVNAPTGTFIAYATSPDMTANDGRDRNGLYTGELLKSIRKVNLTIEQTFKDVRKSVDVASNGKQIPWDSSSLRGDFYFNLAYAKTTKSETPIKVETVAAKDAAAVEHEAWGYIKNSQNEQNFRDFLKDFPSGANARNARIKLEQAVWDAVKDSKDKSKIQAYLNEFSAGVNAPLARIRLRQLETPVVTPPVTSDEQKSEPLEMGSLIAYATKLSAPNYPESAKLQKITGVVRLNIIIDELGNVEEITSVSGPNLLQSAAKDAIMKWKFKPFSKDGKLVKAIGFISFNFAL